MKKSYTESKTMLYPAYNRTSSWLWGDCEKFWVWDPRVNIRLMPSQCTKFNGMQTTYNLSSHFFSLYSEKSTGFLFSFGFGLVGNPILSNNWNWSLVNGFDSISFIATSPAASTPPSNFKVTLHRSNCVLQNALRDTFVKRPTYDLKKGYRKKCGQWTCCVRMTFIKVCQNRTISLNSPCSSEYRFNL